MNISYSRLFLSNYFWIVVAGFSFYFLYPLRKAMRFGIDLVGVLIWPLKLKLRKRWNRIDNKLQSMEVALKRRKKFNNV